MGRLENAGRQGHLPPEAEATPPAPEGPPGETVLGAFRAYETALVAGDARVLDAMFWDDPRVLRFGTGDRQQGIEEIRRWRATQGPLRGRSLHGTQVLPLGEDVAVVTTLFCYPGRAMEGRQTQVWRRLPDGWRIVSAHVSEVPAAESQT